MQKISANLAKAKEIMIREEYTLVIVKNEVRTFRERGVKPLLSLLDSSIDLSLASASDKVVGKAAAMLYVKLGIKELYASVLSKPALEVLTKNGVSVEYGELVGAIRNRSGDGFCPMESAVINITDIDEAILAVKAKMAELSGKIIQ